MTLWLKLDPRFPFPYGLGLLTSILDSNDSRAVKEQLEDRYSHGGGWMPIKGFRMAKKTRVLTFPGDPPFKPSACCDIGKELVIFYKSCSLLAVIQPDGKFEVCRVD